MAYLEQKLRTSMSVNRTFKDALQCLPDRQAAEEAELWLRRVEVLLEWILQHPKLVEVRHEAARLLTDLRGEDVLEPPPNRRV